MHGYGRIHGRTEFPEDWDEQTILKACAQAVQLPEVAAAINGPEERAKTSLLALMVFRSPSVYHGQGRSGSSVSRRSSRLTRTGRRSDEVDT